MKSWREYDLLEALADIAYLAGRKEYYSGDSRADIAEFIVWAKEFDTLHRRTDWCEVDYIETVLEFAAEKIKEVKNDTKRCLGCGL